MEHLELMGRRENLESEVNPAITENGDEKESAARPVGQASWAKMAHLVRPASREFLVCQVSPVYLESEARLDQSVHRK